MIVREVSSEELFCRALVVLVKPLIPCCAPRPGRTAPPSLGSSPRCRRGEHAAEANRSRRLAVSAHGAGDGLVWKFNYPWWRSRQCRAGKLLPPRLKQRGGSEAATVLAELPPVGMGWLVSAAEVMMNGGETTWMYTKRRKVITAIAITALSLAFSL